MGDRTRIEWTDATWNPVRGCSLISAGCANCYAMRDAHRFAGHGQPYEGLTRLTEHGPVWTGEVRLVPELLDQPLRWKKPRRIFVNSMSDLFHPDVPDHFIEAIFGVMQRAPRHTFQVLTKRPERMLNFVMGRGGEFGLRAQRIGHIWLGVSVEDQKTADERLPMLLRTPAILRWISAEPLLGPIDLGEYLEGDRWMASEEPMDDWLDWVVVGGESGPGARPMDLHWARSIVSQCREAKVPVFVKQLGTHPVTDHRTRPEGECVTVTNLRDRKGGDPSEWPEDLRVREYPSP